MEEKTADHHVVKLSDQAGTASWSLFAKPQASDVNVEMLTSYLLLLKDH